MTSASGRVLASMPELTMYAEGYPMSRPYVKIYLDEIDQLTQAVNAYGVAIYLILLRHRNHKTGQCHPKHRTIAKKLKISESTVKRSLPGVLNAMGITSEPRYDAAGDRTSNQYTFPTPGVQTAGPAPEKGGGFPQTPPPGPTDPTGGVPQTSELDNPQIEQEEANQDIAARAPEKGEDPPPTEAPPERPDACLDRLGLDAPTRSALDNAARIVLKTAGYNPLYVTTGLVHSMMAHLWDHRQAVYPERVETSADPLAAEEGLASATCAV
jgi:Helix-turn-helix domain